MKKINKLENTIYGAGVYNMRDKINELVDEVNRLKSEIKKLKPEHFSILKDEDGPGEIGWNNGDFYKD